MPPLQRVADAARDAVPAPTRRQLLAGVAVAVATGVAGCGPATDAADGGSAPAAPAAVDDGDIELAERAARAAAGLLAAYRATVRRHRSLRSRLDPLAGHHAEHLRVFAPDAGPGGGRAPDVPQAPLQALSALADLERRTSDARRRDAVAADSGDLARALASAAACQAQHLVLLEGPGR